MALKGRLTITVNDDGSIKTDARELQGDEKEILAELDDLTKCLGGDLTVEKHIEGAHDHHHHHHHHKAGHRH